VTVVGPDALIALLRDRDVLSAEWQAVFTRVARADFVPDRVWGEDTDMVLDRRRDPDPWWTAVHSDQSLVTQFDDGRHVGDVAGRLPTSSASAPSTVAEMLFDLDVAPGMRVLEIGTGTGYTAALLAARGCRVVSVEVDPELAERARESLARAGYGDAVVVVTGDGALGYAAAAPFDRVHVTAAVRRIPYAWIDQAAPGAVIVMPWGTGFSHGDCTLRLAVDEDGRSASGPFTMATAFMKLRAQRPEPGRHTGANLHAGPTATTSVSTTTLAWDDVVTGPYEPVGFVLGLCVPGCLAQPVPDGRGGGTLWLYGVDTGDGHSVAAAAFADGHTPHVAQDGPRRLWDEVERAWRWWDGQGRPTVHDFGLTADVGFVGAGAEQVAWYRDRDHPLGPTRH